MRKNLPVTQVEYVLPDGESLVSKTDLKGRITYANPAFIEASGFLLEELMGSAHSLVRHPDMPEAAFADLWVTIQQGKPWSALVKNRRKNGDFYWVRANVTPVAEGRQVVGYMSVRDKPTRQDVAAAEELYRKMRENRLQGVVLREGRLRHTGLIGALSRVGDLRVRIALSSLGSAGLMALVATLGVLHAGASWVIGAALVGSVVTLLAGATLAASLAAPLAEALRAVRGICAGQLDYRSKTTRTDEVGLLLAGVQQMAINLTAVVQDIQAGSSSIHQVTRALAGEMQGLASRTQEQAANLEETAASMEELTATVQNNARSAEQANRVVLDAAGVAERGGTVVGQVVRTMSAIRDSSQKIRDIIGVIDDIAFQTNILALNAAVEAARAGEQGRGFAVVASEVRTLAQRSASAAREIKSLITDSVQRVDDGAALVDVAGRTMDDVAMAVKRVTEIMAEIATASREQATGIEQVGQAVAQLDQITQHNAALVEEATSGTETVELQTEHLDAAVGVFNVARGASIGSLPAEAAPADERRGSGRRRTERTSMAA